jgi:hypothetical protein
MEPVKTETPLPGVEKQRYADLVVGDYVVVQPSSNTGKPMRIVKIVRISDKSRQFALEDGVRFTANGREIGGDTWHFALMFPGGDSVRGIAGTFYQRALASQAKYASLQRRRILAAQIDELTKGQLYTLTEGQLERILEICKEGKKVDGNQ